MKKIKRFVIVLLAALGTVLSFAFSACANAEIIETDRKGKSVVGEWDIVLWHLVSAPTYLGVGVGYEFEGATIETNILSDKTILVILYEKDVLNKWEDLSDYERYFGCKMALKKDCPLMSSGVASFQWAADIGWRNWEGLDRTEQELSDYITFIARIDNHIVGYGVSYVYVSGKVGGGEVLADKEFPQINGKYQNVSEESVKEKIQQVIDTHKSSLSEK